MAVKTHPPNDDEIELSLFGPGVGESVVVHLGDGEWMVADSCPGSERAYPVALEYLRALGVDIAEQVKLVVATHWHDDHIRGLAQILKEASAASFVCSDALQCEEFFALVAADRRIPLVKESSGISEFAEVLGELARRQNGTRGSGSPEWAMEGRCLYRNHRRNVHVWAMSPSSQVITDSKQVIAKLIPCAGEPLRRLPSPTKNDLCVAILVCISDTGFLLGADLEKGRDPARGWQAVVRSSSIPMRPSQAYKVAHHGSQDAHLNEIWSKLLMSSPYAVFTPFVRARRPLPTSEDILRLKGYTNRVYCTAWPPALSPPKRDRAVERTLKEVARTRRASRAKPGHIRLRMRAASERADKVVVELFDGARRLG